MEKREQLIISGMNLNEFFDRLDAKLAALLKVVGNTEPKKSESDSFLTRKETAALLKISLPTLNDWTKNGKLVSHRIGTRVLYKTDEIMDSVRRRNFAEVDLKGGKRAA